MNPTEDNDGSKRQRADTQAPTRTADSRLLELPDPLLQCVLVHVGLPDLAQLVQTGRWLESRFDIWRGLAMHHKLSALTPTTRTTLRSRASPRRAFFKAYHSRACAWALMQWKMWDEIFRFLRSERGNSVGGFKALLRRLEKQEVVDVDFEPSVGASYSLVRIAARYNRPKIVRYLLCDLGAVVDNNISSTAAPTAATSTVSTPSKQPPQHTDIYTQAKRGINSTLLMEAALHGDTHSVRLILDSPACTVSYIDRQASECICRTKFVKSERAMDAEGWAEMRGFPKLAAMIRCRRKKLVKQAGK